MRDVLGRYAVGVDASGCLGGAQGDLRGGVDAQAHLGIYGNVRKVGDVVEHAGAACKRRRLAISTSTRASTAESGSTAISCAPVAR